MKKFFCYSFFGKGKIGLSLFLLTTAMTARLFYTICLCYRNIDRRWKKFNIEKRLKQLSKVIVLRVVCNFEFLCRRIYNTWKLLKQGNNGSKLFILLKRNQKESLHSYTRTPREERIITNYFYIICSITSVCTIIL